MMSSRNLLLILIAIVVIVACASKKTRVCCKGCLNVDKFPLKEGDEGEEVKKLQLFLRNKTQKNIDVSGVMDESTMSVIKNYLQRDSISLNYYVKANIYTLEK